MLRFKHFIIEGGNIKIGDAQAAPFSVTAKNRESRINDVHVALSAIHDEFHKQHGEHLLGHNKEGLTSRKIFTGSSKDFMDKGHSHEEFAKYKPSVGDIDLQVHDDHKPKLDSVLKPETKFGKYTVKGIKKHGKEVSAVMKHKNGEYHQFDFQGVDHPGSESNQFLHSSNWSDTKQGIKGMHHKILLNAIGGDSHKFSITHGLRSRIDNSDPGTNKPHEISKKLFGADVGEHIKSFTGLVHSIKTHIPKERHQQIYDKFKSSLSSKNNIEHTKALGHMQSSLGLKDSVNESVDGEHHVHVAFLGASPFPHVGHGTDIGGSMDSAQKGRRFLGLSGKSDAFSDNERSGIAAKVFGKNTEVKVEKTAGVTVGRAMDSVKREKGIKVLHLHFGHDRADMAHRLKSSILAGKIPELGSHKFDAVYVHLPKDENRSHGLSGTKMRTAASTGDFPTFKKHVGSNFSDSEVMTLMNRTKSALDSGVIKVKR